jgi:hypothetical protein
MTISPTAEIIAEILHGITFDDSSATHWRRIDTQAASHVPQTTGSRI